MNKGFLYAIGAYMLWGLLPIYWKLLQDIPATEIVSHRMVWSLVFMAGLLAYRRQWSGLRLALKNGRVLLTFVVVSSLLVINWLTYVWAVNSGYVVETSLGYFINPLVSVLLGVIFLKERLRPWQWVAIATAAAGVLYLTFSYGSLPWIALVLAFSFGTYGLVKKTTPLKALDGMGLETLLLFFPAVAYLSYQEAIRAGSFGHVDATTTVLLILTGVATGAPLLLFSAAARRIPLSSLGILQYIAPTLQFMLGVFVFAEPFNLVRLVGFCLIWAALIIYSVENLVERRRSATWRYANLAR